MRLRLSSALSIATAGVCLAGGAPAAAQTIRGTVVDAENGHPVQMAGVYLLDRDHKAVAMTLADTLGRYALTVPDSAEYYLFTQRLGYVEVTSHLLAISTGRNYDLDIELRPDAIGMDPLTVTVRNKTLVRWWAFQFGANPNDPNFFPGFRVIQGARLEEAKLRASDNTEALRFLYIPVSHGRVVCVGTWGAGTRAVRRGWHRASSGGDAGGGDAGADAKPESCGRLYVNEVWIPNEHIESIDMASIAVVATYYGEVHMFTRDFDWSLRVR